MPAFHILFWAIQKRLYNRSVMECLYSSGHFIYFAFPLLYTFAQKTLLMCTECWEQQSRQQVFEVHSISSIICMRPSSMCMMCSGNQLYHSHQFPTAHTPTTIDDDDNDERYGCHETRIVNMPYIWHVIRCVQIKKTSAIVFGFY